MREWIWLAVALVALALAVVFIVRLVRRHRRRLAARTQRLSLRDLSLRYPLLAVDDPGPVYPLLFEHVPGGEVMLGSAWMSVRLGQAAGVDEPLSIPWVEVLHVYSGTDDTVFIVMEEGEKLVLPFSAGRDVWERIKRSRAQQPKHQPPVPDGLTLNPPLAQAATFAPLIASPPTPFVGSPPAPYVSHGATPATDRPAAPSWKPAVTAPAVEPRPVPPPTFVPTPPEPPAHIDRLVWLD